MFQGTVSLLSSVPTTVLHAFSPVFFNHSVQAVTMFYICFVPKLSFGIVSTMSYFVYQFKKTIIHHFLVIKY